MISYISTPLKSEVKPYQENIELIAEIANKKQAKYDSVIDSLLNQEYNYLNLDIHNAKIKQEHNDLMKNADKQLNALAKSDLLLPENLNKAEKLFDPIMNNSNIQKGVMYTKKIREAEEFEKETIKKDPSIGNKLNKNVAEEMRNMFYEANPEDLDKIAPYTQIFAPYKDITTDLSKLIKDLGVLNPESYTNSVDIMGVLNEYVKSGKISKDVVYSKINTLMTPEVQHQLMLNGWSSYGKADLNSFLGELEKNIIPQVNSNEKIIESLDERIKLIKLNEAGEPIDGNSIELFYNLKHEKAFYENMNKSYSSILNYNKKYKENGGVLDLDDKFNLFQSLKQEELLGNMTTLFSQDFNTYSYKVSDADQFKANNDFTLAQMKEKKEKEEKIASLGTPIDVNDDGINDGYVKNAAVSYETTTEEDIENIYRPESMNSKKLIVDGQEIIVNLKNTGIKDWKKEFTEEYEGIQNILTGVVVDHLTSKSLNPDTNEVDPNKLKANNALFDNYHKLRISGKTHDEALKAAGWTQENALSSEDLSNLYEAKVNADSSKNLQNIEKAINNHLSKKYKDYLSGALAQEPKTVEELISFEEYIKNVENNRDRFFREVRYTTAWSDYLDRQTKKIKENNGENPNPNLDVVLDFAKEQYEGIKFVKLHPGSKEKSILNNTHLEFMPSVNSFINTGPLQHYGKEYVKEQQEYYKELLTVSKALVINFADVSQKLEDADPLYKSLQGLVNGALTNPSSGLQIKEDKKKLSSAFENKGKSKIESKSSTPKILRYNTATGEVVASIDNQDVYYTVKPEESSLNGIPLGVPSKDIVGKNLVLDVSLNKNKEYSYPVSLGTINDRFYKIAYSKKHGEFILYSTDISNPIGSFKSTFAAENYYKNIKNNSSNNNSVQTNNQNTITITQ